MGRGTTRCIHLFRVILAVWWCEGVALHLDCNSRLLIIQVTWLGGHWHGIVNCKLKLRDKFIQFRCKGLCKKIKKWQGLCYPCLIHNELGIHLIATNRLICSCERCFQCGNSYLPALSNHQISNFRGGCELPQPKAAKPDLWDCAFLSPPRDAKMCQGDAGRFQWAHWGHNSYQKCNSTPHGCGPCFSNTRSDEFRVMSYPADTQATQRY